MKRLILFSALTLTGLAAFGCQTNDTVIYHHYQQKEVPVYRTHYVEKPSSQQTTLPGSPQQLPNPNTPDQFRAVGPN